METHSQNPSKSRLVRRTEGDIPAYLQRDESWYGMLDLFQEPARFNTPKPYQLQNVLSDDHWAALKLRVDPIARNILDPHRIIGGVICLFVLLTAVNYTIRPNLNGMKKEPDEDDDDDDRRDSQFYSYVDDEDDEDKENDKTDDVFRSEYNYKEYELEYELRYWNIVFWSIVLSLVLFTVISAFIMNRRNVKHDNKIREICEMEMSSRFESQGFSPEYRTNQDGMLSIFIRPIRVIVFKKCTPVPIPGRGIRVARDRQKRPTYGTMMVHVPPGTQSGQVMTISTPLGERVQVSVPKGVVPGDQFPVQIPMSMMQPKKRLTTNHDNSIIFT